MKKVLVTGGAGFIGSAFIRELLSSGRNVNIVNLDKLTYAGDTERLKDVEDTDGYEFVKGDICDADAVEQIFSSGVDTVVHFAAESHVDRSIEDSSPFESTNVRGTLTLLEAAKRHGVGKFVHISTDEVYGELGKDGCFTEQSPLMPNSPYSASKASGDLFALSYHHTFGLPVLIARPSNNYGPWQYPEKLIPVAVSRALGGLPVPVYARGENVREWLFVQDCARGIIEIMDRGAPGEIYNVGSGEEKRNIDVVINILKILDKPESLIEFVPDRPGHDFRYSLDCSKIKKELGFSSETRFDEGLKRTVRWYADNETWLRRHRPDP